MARDEAEIAGATGNGRARRTGEQAPLARAVPKDSLSRPHLGRQGDEQRSPSPEQRRRLAEIQAKQRDGKA